MHSSLSQVAIRSKIKNRYIYRFFVIKIDGLLKIVIIAHGIIKYQKIWKQNNYKFLLSTSPCQMYECDKQNVDRNNLIKYVIKFIKITRPDNILIENVSPILNFPICCIGKRKIKIGEYIKNELSQYKYYTRMEILDAVDFRTSQHRKRAIILFRKRNEN